METACVSSVVRCQFISKTSSSVRRSSPFSISRSDLSHCPITCWMPRGKRASLRSLRCGPPRASSAEPAGWVAPFAPLQLESPIGQLLSQILISHPHLVSATVEQQLGQLQTDRDALLQREEPLDSANDIILHRRIAEVKANERRKAVEEILYALIVQKFMDANLSLVPTIATRPATNGDVARRMDSWPSEHRKFGLLHSCEAYEMIHSHIALIMGSRVGDSTNVVRISKVRVGQVYAASIMYGYFIKRVDQRFQLEKRLQVFPKSMLQGEIKKQQETKEEDERYLPKAITSSLPSRDPGQQPAWVSPLQSYLLSFDIDTLQRYATIRSKEAVVVIEKHTEALFGSFGGPNIVITSQASVESAAQDVIVVSFGTLCRLILEAVTFGSFLWDAETYVDSRYHFTVN